jgi:hypothetical protein
MFDVQVTPYLKPEEVTARLEDGCYITGMVSPNLWLLSV